jgi:hypothetical protein
MTMPNLTATVASTLRVKLDAPELNVRRNLAILAHYQREVDVGHMDSLSATKRCIADMCGRNGPSSDRREVKLTTNHMEY